jgi:hypothetical protein
MSSSAAPSTQALGDDSQETKDAEALLSAMEHYHPIVRDAVQPHRCCPQAHSTN